MGHGQQSIYDYPLYYDILFGWNRDAEGGFYDAAFRHYGVPPGGRLLEIGVGTGQVALRLAGRGWQVTGLDVRPDMLSFLKAAAGQAGLSIRTVCADMTGFTLKQPQDGAYCPLSTFRILESDEAALSHLRAVAGVLRGGGVYVLDLAFRAETEAAHEPPAEQWAMRRGGVEVRTDAEKVYVEDAASGRRLTLEAGWGGSPALRPYGSRAFVNLLDRSDAFTLEAWHPEAGRSREGISIFDVQRPGPLPMAGRGMAVLRRAAGAA
jgi:SAM-dependent methyltransferase